MRSLKYQLTLSVTGATVGVAVVAGLVLYLLARAYLLDQFDEGVANKARLLASTIKLENGELDTDFEDLDLSEFRSPSSGGYLQLWYEGWGVFRSPSLGDRELAAAEASEDLTAARWIDLPGGRLGRGVVYRFVPKIDPDSEPEPEPGAETWPDPIADPKSEEASDIAAIQSDGGRPAVLCLVRDAGQLTHALMMLRVGLLAVGSVLALILTLVIQRVVAKAMRPVDGLAGELAKLDADSLDRQVSAQQLPPELQPVLDQFNQLAVRLHGAFERERTFSADIAHELRTPLAGLRTTVEVALSRPRSTEQYKQSLEALLEVVNQMQRLVEGLLQLAALDNGLGRPKFEKLGLNARIRDAWEGAVGVKPGQKEFSVDFDLDPDDPVVASDPALLALIFRNVFHNAVTYVNDGGTVRITTQRLSGGGGGGLRVRVVNSGCTLAAEDAAKVFDRFWRADPSRAATGTRFGLGLALAHRAVRALGGAISATCEHGGDFAIALDLPAVVESTGKDLDAS